MKRGIIPDQGNYMEAVAKSPYIMELRTIIANGPKFSLGYDTVIDGMNEAKDARRQQY